MSGDDVSDRDVMRAPALVDRDNAASKGTFADFRKVATTRISTFTMPPGTVYQTPEGLRAEDEETRIAFDVQGGVYPIRESVFAASYEPNTASGGGAAQSATTGASANGPPPDGVRPPADSNTLEVYIDRVVEAFRFLDVNGYDDVRRFLLRVLDGVTEDSSPLGHGTPVPEEATLPSGDARVAGL